MKGAGASGTDRNSGSPPYRSRYCDARARDCLIWDQRKRLSRCLAGGPSAEAWSVSHCQISDTRRSFAASLVIFWAFLGIRASAAGRATGKLIPMADLEHVLLAICRETRTASANAGVGTVSGLRDSQPCEKPASLAVPSVFGLSRGPWSGPVLRTLGPHYWRRSRSIATVRFQLRGFCPLNGSQ